MKNVPAVAVKSIRTVVVNNCTITGLTASNRRAGDATCAGQIKPAENYLLYILSHLIRTNDKFPNVGTFI
jgi:hypothetical protein